MALNNKPTASDSTDPAPSGQMRSPNFPAITLPEALKKVKVLYDADSRTPVSTKVLLGHLGYGEKMSGAAGRMMAALRQYGLIQEVVGDKYRVSDDAFHILTLSEDSLVRKKAVHDTSMRPAMFRAVTAEFKQRLPSDSALRDYLITEKKFNPASVETFIRALKGTIDFAKLYDSPYNGDELSPGNGTEKQVPGVGDFVQWESQGMLQFESRRVTGVSPDGAYVMVEGSQTGIPMEQVSKVEPPQAPIVAAASVLRPPLGAVAVPARAAVTGVSREVFALGGGVPDVALEWPQDIDNDTIDEVEDWLRLVVRKLRRMKKSQAPTDLESS